MVEHFQVHYELFIRRLPDQTVKEREQMFVRRHHQGKYFYKTVTPESIRLHNKECGAILYRNAIEINEIGKGAGEAQVLQSPLIQNVMFAEIIFMKKGF